MGTTVSNCFIANCGRLSFIVRVRGIKSDFTVVIASNVEAVLAGGGRYKPAIKDIAGPLFTPGGKKILSFPSISLGLHAGSQLGNSGMRAIEQSGVGRACAS